jgi:phospholipase/lecithinase/hemolysin
LYTAGARSFLLLTIPPTDRAPLFIQQGPSVTNRLKPLVANYNKKLTSTVTYFKARHRDLDLVEVFDTQPIFNTLLDNAKALGYANATGWCEAYQNGTPGRTTQIAPCPPVSSYL